jgi:hypothetical protein
MKVSSVDSLPILLVPVVVEKIFQLPNQRVLLLLPAQVFQDEVLADLGEPVVQLATVSVQFHSLLA